MRSFCVTIIQDVLCSPVYTCVMTIIINETYHYTLTQTPLRLISSGYSFKHIPGGSQEPPQKLLGISGFHFSTDLHHKYVNPGERG